MNFDNVTEWRIPVNGVTRDVLKVTRNNVVLWEKEESITTETPFFVQNISNTVETLNIKKNKSSAPTLTIEYSTDKSTWSTFGTTSTTALTMPINPKSKVYLRASTSSWASFGSTNDNMNSITGVSRVGGNIMSLLYGSRFTGQETSFSSAYTFTGLFLNNTNLIDASNLLLPATTLKEDCYAYMFEGCSNMIKIIDTLPASILAPYCYKGMFLDCTSLTSSPSLPATTLADSCYCEMFYRCSSLSVPPVLNATTLKQYCYSYMFNGCTSLTIAPELPANTLVKNCYTYMFGDCTSLTTAPELSATVLVEWCYANMFYGCTSLNNIKCLATSGINVSFSTNAWTRNVSSTGTFIKAAGVTWPTGASGIPSGWTVVEV